MAGTPLRIPPQNLDSERALLGSIMLRPDAMYEVVDTVSPESFYATKHRIIFETMVELFSKGDPIDSVSLSSRLKEKKKLEEAGGLSLLAELTDTVPSSVNARHYAGLVQKAHLMRLLIEASHYIAELGYSEDREIEDVLDDAQKKVFDVTNSPTTQKFTALTDVLGEAFDRLDALHHGEQPLRGIPTGFPELDTKISGLQKSDLIILAARPSMGKTSLALDIARHTAIRHGSKVGIFSLEMSAQQLVDRMIASEANVDAWRLRTGRLKTDEEFDRIRDGLDKLAKAKIYIDDQPGNTILKMRSVARKLKSEHNLDLIIVDYLQLMMPSSGRNYDSMVQQVTEISRSLKQLARELEVPVLALSQLSRAVESRGGKPRLSDLRDSGSIEQDADMVWFIHREDKYKENSDKPNIAEIMIEKHRNGPTGRIELYFDEQKATFLSLEKHAAQGYETLAQGGTEETF